MTRLQPLTRHRLAAMGEEGRAWTAALPELLAGLERDWSITIGRDLPGGSASYVARARTEDGKPVVVKVAVIADGWPDQVATLARAAGRGYARLLRSDPTRRAALLEALGPSLSARGWSPTDQLRCLADTLALAWQDAGRMRAEPRQGQRSGRADPRGMEPSRPALLGTGSRPGPPLRRTPGSGGRSRPGRRARRSAPGQPAHRPRAAARRGDGVRVRGPGRVRRRPRLRPRRRPAGLDQPAARARRPPRRRGVLRCARRPQWRGRPADLGVGFLERVSTGLYVLDVVGAPDRVARPYLDSAARLVD